MHSKYTTFHVFLTTYNEEARIFSVLERLTRHCALVTVVDNYSKDSTLEIVSNSFAHVNAIQISNPGSIEVPAWWRSIQPYIKAEYILLASCSEIIPYKLLEFFSFISNQKFIDILHVPRTSFTSDVCTDWLYADPLSIIVGKLILPSVGRLVKYNSVNPRLVRPHDSFRSQTQCRTLVIKTLDPELIIYHMRPKPTIKTLHKHTMYAQISVIEKFQSNVLLALVDSLSRFLLDTLRLFVAAQKMCVSIILLQEYLLRILMHLQVVFYSIKYLVGSSNKL
jgi:hypothetical protein